MRAMTAEELALLSPKELVERMDEFFQKLVDERTADSGFSAPRLLNPNNFSSTVLYRDFAEVEKRKFVWTVFDYLMQYEITFQYVLGLRKIASIRTGLGIRSPSPLVQLENAGMMQAVGISSRICFERLMDLVYFTENRTGFPATDSRFGEFVKYLESKETESDYKYFYYYLPDIRKWQSIYRDSEIHFGSKWKNSVIGLRDNTSQYYEDLLTLHNMLFQMGQGVVEILNQLRPRAGTAIGNGNTNWLHDFATKDIGKISIALSDISTQLRDPASGKKNG